MDRPKFFFSYARTDSEFVLRLARELRAVGVEFWLDQLDIRGGQRWDSAIEEALQACPGMLIVLTPESLASNSVMDEVSYALEEQKLVVPILLRPCDIPFRLRRVQHVDFTKSYEAGFENLLKALQLERRSAQAAQPIAAIETPAAVPPNPVPPLSSGVSEPPDPRQEEPEHKQRLPRWARGALVGFGLGAIVGSIGAFSQESLKVSAIFFAYFSVVWTITGALIWHYGPRNAAVAGGLIGIATLFTLGPSIALFGVLAWVLFGRRLVERWAEKT